jgi:hypothetical protein
MSRKDLLPEEKETIILWDEGTDTAQISTHDTRLISKLNELAKKYPEQFRREALQYNEAPRYSLPKRCVTIRTPYSEERRQQQIEQAAAPHQMEET